MKLIEDLGMQYPTEVSKKKKHFGIYECPVCERHFRCRVADIKSGNTTKCRVCADKAIANDKINKASAMFIDKALRIHNNKYDYTLIEYLGNRVKIQVICPTHGVFWQRPNEHLIGQGCPECAKERSSIALRMSIRSGKPTTFYYIYLPEHNLWKVGCTERDVEARFKYEKTTVEILGVKTYDDSREAYFVEGWLLRATKDRAISGKVLKGGNSELRSAPIPNLLDLVKEAEASFKDTSLALEVL